jgi:hypothetical protein
LAVLSAADSNPKPTFAREISRIVQKNCEGCHRPGQIGPFSLTNYEEVRTFATEIKRATQARRMPPWHAIPNFGPAYKNDRRLSDEDLDLISRWVDSGAPLGNPKDLPTRLKWSEDWALGKPDAVISMSEDWELEAAGVDEYRCFVIPTNYDSVRWVQGFEMRPGNRKVVHHVLVYTDTTGRARELDSQDPKPGFNCFGGLGFLPSGGLGGWAPGMTPGKLPPDIGRALPKGADIVMQMHYHKSGKKEKDRTSLGLYFSNQTPTRFISSRPVANPLIRIPAGAANHVEKASWTAPEDILAYSIMPHMHLLGKEMKVVATLPDGTVKPLVWVKGYDFNWQTTYQFAEPFVLPKGTRVDVTGVFDNSENNPRNPSNPLRDVRWGEATTDEMLIGWLGFVTDHPPARRR